MDTLGFRYLKCLNEAEQEEMKLPEEAGLRWCQGGKTQPLLSCLQSVQMTCSLELFPLLYVRAWELLPRLVVEIESLSGQRERGRERPGQFTGPCWENALAKGKFCPQMTGYHCSGAVSR